METESKIIKFFIEKKTPSTIREIAGRIGSDYRITHTAVQRLIAKGIILADTVGKSTLCRMNNVYYGRDVHKVEWERKEDILKNSNMRQLYKEIMEKLKTSFFIFLVFGSYVNGKKSIKSDIDLMFVSNEHGFEKRVFEIFSLLPLKTHVLVFTEEEFMRMKDSKKSNVVKEAIDHNIILYGTETYYRIKNA